MANERIQRVITEDIPADYKSRFWWSGFWWATIFWWGLLFGCYFDVLPAMWRALWGGY